MRDNTQARKALIFRFERVNKRPPDATMLSWMEMAFKLGYDRGQNDFMKNHDWYE